MNRKKSFFLKLFFNFRQLSVIFFYFTVLQDNLYLSAAAFKIKYIANQHIEIYVACLIFVILVGGFINFLALLTTNSTLSSTKGLTRKFKGLISKSSIA